MIQLNGRLGAIGMYHVGDLAEGGQPFIAIRAELVLVLLSGHLGIGGAADDQAGAAASAAGVELAPFRRQRVTLDRIIEDHRRHDDAVLHLHRSDANG